MLVLSRRHGETIRVGGDIEVVVLHVHGDRVKLGIAAPREIPVRRSELPLDRQTTRKNDDDRDGASSH